MDGAMAGISISSRVQCTAENRAGPRSRFSVHCGKLKGLEWEMQVGNGTLNKRASFMQHASSEFCLKLSLESSSCATIAQSSVLNSMPATPFYCFSPFIHNLISSSLYRLSSPHRSSSAVLAHMNFTIISNSFVPQGRINPQHYIGQADQCQATVYAKIFRRKF